MNCHKRQLWVQIRSVNINFMRKVPSLNFVLLSGLFCWNQFRAPVVDACTRNETKFAWHPFLISYRRRQKIIAVVLNFIISVEQWLKLWWHVQRVKHLCASCSLRNQAKLFIASCKKSCCVSSSSLMRNHFHLKLLHFYSLNMKSRSVWCWNIVYKSLESVMG